MCLQAQLISNANNLKFIIDDWLRPVSPWRERPISAKRKTNQEYKNRFLNSFRFVQRKRVRKQKPSQELNSNECKQKRKTSSRRRGKKLKCKTGKLLIWNNWAWQPASPRPLRNIGDDSLTELRELPLIFKTHTRAHAIPPNCICLRVIFQKNNLICILWDLGCAAHWKLWLARGWHTFGEGDS